MKKTSLIIFALTVFALYSRAQQPAAVSISLKITQRMKDSLGLTETQKFHLHQINMQMDSSRQVIWRNISSDDSLRFFLQQIENTRDSLYRPVFTEQQYQWYLQKKSKLINND